MEIRIERNGSPKPKTPEDRLGFGIHYTDHMFVMDFSDGKGWHNPAIVPYAPILMDPAAMTLHYGQSVFEGLKAYRAADGRILLFRPEQNFRRLNVSCDRLCIPAIDENLAIEAMTGLIKIEASWIPSGDGTSLYIRPFVFADEPHLGVRPAHTYKFMIILSPVGSYYEHGIAPVRIYIEDEYVRAVRGGLGYTKASANYAASLKSQEKAKQLGYTQILWLDGVERKYIEEVGTSNAFFVIDGELVTPELNGSILPGITRDSVIALSRSWGVPVSERPITVQELYDAHDAGRLEEVFASGTAAVISPVGELNWAGRAISVNNGEIGPMARRLYDELTAMQTGRAADPFGWVREVK
jgi:branched-chain amino acid aminotransferase